MNRIFSSYQAISSIRIIGGNRQEVIRAFSHGMQVVGPPELQRPHRRTVAIVLQQVGSRDGRRRQVSLL